MGEELILKIVDVNPQTSINDIGNIIKASGEWYTKDAEAKITIDFGNAVISQISIQNFNADEVSIQLKGDDNNELYYDKIIWKKDIQWNKTQNVDINEVSQEIFNQMIIQVLNYTQKEYKGLKRIRVYGIQDEQLYNQRKKNIKSLKKQSKDKQKKQEIDTSTKNKSEQKDTNINQIKVDGSSNKKNNKWELYNKSNNQSNKEQVFNDPREKLRNIHKSPSPIREEIHQFNQNSVQNSKSSDIFEKLGQNINEINMIRYNFNQIDKQFLELHQQLQKSLGIGKDKFLNQTNFEIHWLK
ncbi:unnamed protein product [Paramecium sonneborni]|uniref:Uncharacterized protein n=1 Tax=Paramecium sonneborni TaxID=65129 RepID=A0A8S1RAN7_9CILI|nr:unnamed protein product [Paramecium sonneborni]